MKLLFCGLTSVDNNNKPILNIAKSVNISNDNLTYTFTLKKTFWSNGDEVTSEDFVRSFKYASQPEFISHLSSLLSIIKNYTLVRNGTVNSDQLGIEAIDKYTLKITLEHPSDYFLHLLSHPIFSPRHKNPILTPNKDYFCNGPFILHCYETDKKIILKKNKHFISNENSSNIDVIKFLHIPNNTTQYHLFNSKAIDWLGPPFGSVTQGLSLDIEHELQCKNKLLHKPIIGTHFILFNFSEFPFSDNLFRQCFSLAIDKQAITNNIGRKGTNPASSFCPTDIFNLPNSKNDFNTEQANSLLNDFLKKHKLSKKDISLKLSFYSFSEKNLLTAQIIQQQIQKNLGLNLVLYPTEFATHVANKNKGEFQIILTDFLAEQADVLNCYEYLHRQISITNKDVISPMSQLIQSTKLTTDKQKKESLLIKLESIIKKDFLAIPLYHHSLDYYVNQQIKDYVILNTGITDFSSAKLS